MRKFSHLRFVAHGVSMLPILYPGDLLTIESFASEPRCGEIVLCRHTNGFRVHRIVKILGNAPDALYILRGDALTQHDPPAHRDDLLGRLTSLERNGARFEIDATQTLRRRILCSVIRRSTVATALLLRSHLIRARFTANPAPSASSLRVRTECP